MSAENLRVAVQRRERIGRLVRDGFKVHGNVLPAALGDGRPELGLGGEVMVDARQVADELNSKLGVRPDDVMINMMFVDREDWLFGRGRPW